MQWQTYVLEIVDVDHLIVTVRVERVRVGVGAVTVEVYVPEYRVIGGGVNVSVATVVTNVVVTVDVPDVILLQTVTGSTVIVTVIRSGARLSMALRRA